MSFETVKKNLEAKGYTVTCFETAAEAAEYLDRAIDGVTVGCGGSITLDQLGIYEKLTAHNTVYWHQHTPEGLTPVEMRDRAKNAKVYLSSVNGLAETGEVINIDGTGNRVASTYYGHEKVYLVVGKNKLAPDFDKALWRARNVAAPMNAKRLNRNTPCVAGGHCFNCNSPERICRGLSVFWYKPGSAAFEVVLINENLGY